MIKMYGETFAVLLLAAPLFVSGCASIGNEATMAPVPDSNWQYPSENYFRHDAVQYRCRNFNISVREVPLRSKTYFFGPVVPVFPLFQGLDTTRRNPQLDILLETTAGTRLSGEELSKVSITDEKKEEHGGNGSGMSESRDGSARYRIVFDMRRDSAANFTLSFTKPLEECAVPPLRFKLKDETGYRLWMPGP